jgi:hypothetical protein
MIRWRLVGLALSGVACGQELFSGAGSNDGSVSPDALDANIPSDSGDATDGGSESQRPCPLKGLVTLASGQRNPGTIAVDNDNVYWANTDSDHPNDSIVQVAKCGGAPITLVSGQPSIGGIAVHGANVYWGRAQPREWPGHILRVPIGGGAVTTLVSGVYARALAVDDESIYWVNAPWNEPNSVMRVPVNGGKPTTLYAASNAVSGPREDIESLALDLTNVYWSLIVTQPAAPQSTSVVLATPLGGGETSTLTTLGNVPSSYLSNIAVNATDLFWLRTAEDGGDTVVMRVPLAGGRPDALTTPAYFRTGPLAADRERVYWVESSGLMSIPVTGGAPTLVALDEPGVDVSQGYQTTIVADDGAIYWTNSAAQTPGGTVMRYAPE